MDRIVRPGGRIFKRMRCVHIEEAAAVCTKLLDRLLTGHRPERDDLLGAFDGRGFRAC